MSPSTYLLIYLVFFSLFFVTELVLLISQLKNLKRNNKLDSNLEKYFDNQVIKKSVEYSRDKLKVDIFSHFYSNLFLLLIILTGTLGILEMKFAVEDNYYTYGIFLILFIVLAFQFISLPVDLYSTFKIEEKYGFNRTTIKQWLVDLLKGILISAVILTVLIAVVIMIIENLELWWLAAFIFIFLFQIFLLYIYPVWIAPIFNKFQALSEGSLREKIFELSKKLDFPLAEVFIMDGSRRSSHGNAYFTGFGKNQRIVLFDTLLEELTEEELLAVLAHEIGHKKLNHIKKSLVFQTVLMFGIFYLMGTLYYSEALHLAFGFNTSSPISGIIIFSLLFSPFLYFLSPVFSMLQRKFEYEADSYAKTAMESAQPLVDALIKLHKTNLSNLFPHPWYSFFHYSHPTLIERVEHLNSN